jgi:hypothetical protein
MRRTSVPIPPLLILLILGAFAPIVVQSSGREDFTLARHVIPSSGGTTSSTAWWLRFTLAEQPTIGECANDDYVLWSGFFLKCPGYVCAVADSTCAPPTLTRLHAPRPSAGQGQFTLRYDLASSAPVRLAIFDVQGRHVRLLDSGNRDPGTYEIRWDGMDSQGHQAAPGVYFARFRGDIHNQVERLLLVR